MNIEEKNEDNTTITYTPEDVARLLADKDKELQSIVDERVNQALETQRNKFENEKNVIREEAAMEQSLSDKELIASIQAELDVMKRENATNKNMNVAHEMLSKNGIDISSVQNLIGNLVTDNTELSNKNIEILISTLSGIRTKYEDEFKTKMSNVPMPQTQSVGNEVTQEMYDKMNLSQKIKFGKKYPELANKYLN